MTSFNLTTQNEWFAHELDITSACFGFATGELVASGAQDCLIKVWKVGNSRPLLNLKGHLNNIKCVAFTSSDDQLVSGCQGGSLRVWDLTQGTLIRSMGSQGKGVESLDTHPYAHYFATGSQDGRLRIWDARKRSPVATYSGHHAELCTIQHSPDGQWIASGDADGSVKIWDIAAGKLLRNVSKTGVAVGQVEFHPTEMVIGVSGADGHVQFWDLDTWTSLQNVDTLEPAQSLTFAEYASLAYIGTGKDVQVWNWETRQLLETVRSNWSRIFDIKYETSDRIRAVCAQHSLISVYEIQETIEERVAHEPVKQREDSTERRKSNQNQKDIPLPRGTPEERAEPSPRRVSVKPIHTTAPPIVESTKVPPVTAAVKAEKTTSPEKKVIQTPLSTKQRKPESPPRPKSTNKVDSIVSACELNITPLDENTLQQSILDRHETLRMVLSSRLSQLEMLGNLWADGNVKESLEYLRNSADLPVAVDFLSGAEEKFHQGLLTLEFASVLLPTLSRLLSSKFEEHVLTSVRLLDFIVERFGGFVGETHKTLATNSALQAVDFAREQRIEWCSICYKEMQEMIHLCKELGDKEGELGRRARALDVRLTSIL